jgi:hypothetical protein
MEVESTMISRGRSFELNFTTPKVCRFRGLGHNRATPPDLSAILFGSIVFRRLRAVMLQLRTSEQAVAWLDDRK